MDLLLLFIFGILFERVVLPVLDNASYALQNLFGWMTSFFQLKIAINQQVIDSDVNDESNSNKLNCIGFQVDNTEFVDEYED